MWCHAMVAVRGYSPSYVASLAGVSLAAINSAVTRVECGRYEDS